MANPNILNLTNIAGVSSVYIVTTSLATTGVSVATNTLARVSSILAANILGASAATISVSVFRGGVHYYLAKDISVPGGASLYIVGKAAGGLTLMEGDVLYAQSGTSSAIHLTTTYDVLT